MVAMSLEAENPGNFSKQVPGLVVCKRIKINLILL